MHPFFLPSLFNPLAAFPTILITIFPGSKQIGWENLMLKKKFGQYPARTLFSAGKVQQRHTHVGKKQN
jgi:hypothetical protein